MKRTSIFWLLFSASHFCYADINQDNTYVEHLVVSGTKTPKLLSNSPVSVNVIEGHTLGQITHGTLAQALDFIPSVVVTRSVKAGYNVQMQGFDSEHVLVLLDCQPLISPAGSSVDLDQISALQIDRIEVIKGASSVLYGSAAMGGVINVITKEDEGEMTSLTYELGSYANNALTGTRHATTADPVSQLVNVSTSQVLGDWRHQLTLLHSQDAGFDYDEESAKQDAANLDKTFLNLTSSLEVGGVNSLFKYRYLTESKEKVTDLIPNRTNYFFYISDVEQHQLDARFNPNDRNWAVNSRYIKHDETSGQTNGLRETKISLAEIDGIKTWQFGDVTPESKQDKGAELVVGGSLHSDTLQQEKPISGSVEIDDKQRTSIESYGQLNWITKSYQLLFGIRGQEDSDFGFHSATRIGGLVNFGNKRVPLKLRLGLGQGYRVPDLKERYYEFDHSNLGYMVLGDNSLKPERAETFNLSLNYRSPLFNDEASYNLELSGHFAQTQDMITTVNDAELSADKGLSISRYANVESADIYGFDLSTELAFDAFAIQFNYSYLDSQDETGRRLENRPRHQLKANFNLDIASIDANAILYLVHQADEVLPSDYLIAKVDRYSLVNFRFNQRLNQELNWHLSLNNLFDEHQSPDANRLRQFDPRPVSSREVRLGLQYRF